MRRKPSKIRVQDGGEIEITDPGIESCEFLRDLGHEIRSSPLDGFNGEPRFQKTRRHRVGISPDDLAAISTSDLWRTHDDAIGALAGSGSGASLLDVKIALCQRLMKECTLCGHNCRVNRMDGQRGLCRLDSEAYVYEHFLHLAEEGPVNPSYLISLTGCGLRCRFCQQHELLNNVRDGINLNASIWKELDLAQARSLSFIGGNPSESLFSILQFLNAAAMDMNLPVAWNCNAYENPDTIRLLGGIADVFIPDLKFSSPRCAKRLSAADDYPTAAQAAVKAMLAQNVPVIARMLAMPGHNGCCHKPAIDFLAGLSSPHLRFSIRKQYFPEWKITPKDAENRRPTESEVEELQTYLERFPVLKTI